MHGGDKLLRQLVQTRYNIHVHVYTLYMCLDST